jgi:hypothetical protein
MDKKLPRRYASESHQTLFTLSQLKAQRIDEFCHCNDCAYSVVEFSGFGHLIHGDVPRNTQKSPQPQQILHDIIRVPLVVESYDPVWGIHIHDGREFQYILGNIFTCIKLCYIYQLIYQFTHGNFCLYGMQEQLNRTTWSKRA